MRCGLIVRRRTLSGPLNIVPTSSIASSGTSDTLRLYHSAPTNHTQRFARARLGLLYGTLWPNGKKNKSFLHKVFTQARQRQTKGR